MARYKFVQELPTVRGAQPQNLQRRTSAIRVASHRSSSADTNRGTLPSQVPLNWCTAGCSGCSSRSSSLVKHSGSRGLVSTQARIVDTSRSAINGYRVVTRIERSTSDFAMAGYKSICELDASTLDAVFDRCTALGYNIIRDNLRIVDGEDSTTMRLLRTLLVRWMLSTVVMLSSYRIGATELQSVGIGVLSRARGLQLLPMFLLRLKANLAVFAAIGSVYDGGQSALAEAWFLMYPRTAELVVFVYSLLNLVAKLLRRKVSDVLFGPMLAFFCAMHFFRTDLAQSGWFEHDGRIATVLTSKQFEHLSVLEFFTSGTFLKLNGNVKSLFLIKVSVLSLSFLPLLCSKAAAHGDAAVPTTPETILALHLVSSGGLGSLTASLLSSFELLRMGYLFLDQTWLMSIHDWYLLVLVTPILKCSAPSVRVVVFAVKQDDDNGPRGRCYSIDKRQHLCQIWRIVDRDGSLRGHAGEQADTTAGKKQPAHEHQEEHERASGSMYNGIGLRTVRGSGTNGYVQRNLSYVNATRTRQTLARNQRGGHAGDRFDQGGSRSRLPANPEILLHEQKRKIEVQLMEMTIEMEDRGCDEDEIQSKVTRERERLLAKLTTASNDDSAGGRRRRDEGRDYNNNSSHARMRRKEEENTRMKDAFDIASDHVPGESFDPEMQEKRRQERIAKREKEKEEREAARQMRLKEREDKQKELERRNRDQSIPRDSKHRGRSRSGDRRGRRAASRSRSAGRKESSDKLKSRRDSRSTSRSRIKSKKKESSSKPSKRSPSASPAGKVKMARRDRKRRSASRSSSSASSSNGSDSSRSPSRSRGRKASIDAKESKPKSKKTRSRSRSRSCSSSGSESSRSPSRTPPRRREQRKRDPSPSPVKPKSPLRESEKAVVSKVLDLSRPLAAKNVAVKIEAKKKDDERQAELEQEKSKERSKSASASKPAASNEDRRRDDNSPKKQRRASPSPARKPTAVATSTSKKDDHSTARGRSSEASKRRRRSSSASPADRSARRRRLNSRSPSRSSSRSSRSSSRSHSPSRSSSRSRSRSRQRASARDRRRRRNSSSSSSRSPSPKPRSARR